MINLKMDRRKFIQQSVSVFCLAQFGALLSACNRHRFVRPSEDLDLGSVRELLYSQVHVPARAALVFRDINGWRALSTRCTYIPCDLTYQDPVLLCPCCRSRFDLEGRKLEGSLAPDNLPWMEMFYKDGRLYANPAKIVPATYRFTTPEIEASIKLLRERIKDEGVGDEAKIPEVLLGEGNRDSGKMFLDEDPDLIKSIDEIK